MTAGVSASPIPALRQQAQQTMAAVPRVPPVMQPKPAPAMLPAKPIPAPKAVMGQGPLTNGHNGAYGLRNVINGGNARSNREPPRRVDRHLVDASF